MKQVLQSLKTGAITVEDVPRPLIRPGALMVRNRHSLISAGTEGGTVKLGRMSLAGKARARPEQVKKVVNVVRTEGLLTAYQAATRSLAMPVAMGYSCAGEVVETGPEAGDFQKGDLVACGGGGLAVHAEYVVVPRNLCVAIPRGVDTEKAAFTTVGSIALQGLRIAEVNLGQKVVVIGLGLVGLITVGLLKAAGCDVLGVDVDPERVEFAERHGYCPGVARNASNLLERVSAFTHGHGADAVIITAAAPNNDPVALAGELARYKAVVVVVGRTEINAPRDTYLFKELELRTSLAYGPGTGDPDYEDKGLDYPIGYVRWTENRNMLAFLEQVQAGRIDLAPLITHRFPLDDAPRAYDLITGSEEKPVGVILEYSAEPASEPGRIPLRRPPAPSAAPDTVRVGVIGAGSFATNFLIPALAGQSKVKLQGIASATGVRARAIGDKYGFAYCTSRSEEILEDDGTDCVFVLTRHDTHASYAVSALKAGKHVFVEKPLSLAWEGLAEVMAAQRETGREVMVGFNRPYAALSLDLRRFLQGRSQPLAMTFRANVGYRPPEHWLHDPAQGGGVLLGEACHFFDYALWLTNAEPVEVVTWPFTQAGSGVVPEDNFHSQVRFSDGSVATIAYLSCGDPSTSRERLEVLAEGGLAVIEDFNDLRLIRHGKKQRRRLRAVPDKGYRGEVRDFLEAVRGRGPARGIHRRHFLSMAATLAAEDSLKNGRIIAVALPKPEIETEIPS